MTARVHLNLMLSGCIISYPSLMSQKYLNKNPKIKVGGASKRRNQPTKQNMNKAGISNRQIHKKSSKLTKIIETQIASQVGGASGMAGGMLNLVKIDKQVLGRIMPKKTKTSALA
jgi:hypothetical protein